MSVTSRGVKNAFRNTIRSISITAILAQRTDMTYEMEDGQLTPGHGVAELTGAAAPAR